MVKPKALVAEDEAVIRRFCGRLLEGMGYQTILASHGTEALVAIESTPFDLIITDLRMPDLDGIQLLKAAKEKHPQAEVILITAYATLDSALQAWKEGAAYYLRKPFTADELQAAIEKCRRRREWERGLKDSYSWLAIWELNQALLEPLSPTAVGDLLLEKISRILSPARALLLLEEQGLLRVASSRGLPLVQKQAMRLENGPLSRALEAKAPSLIQDGQRDPVLRTLFPQEDLSRTFLCSPLVAMGRVLGGVVLSAREDGVPWESEDEEVSFVLSSQGALALQNIRLAHDRQRLYATLSELAGLGEKLKSRPFGPNLLRALDTSLSSFLYPDFSAFLIALPLKGKLLLLSSRPLKQEILSQVQEEMIARFQQIGEDRIGGGGIEVEFNQAISPSTLPPLSSLGPMTVLAFGKAGGPRGLLALAGVQEEQFDPEEKALLRITADLLSLALESPLFPPDREDLPLVARALLAVMEVLDPELRDHSFHTARYAKQLSLKLEMSPTEVEKLIVAGMLHDVGKVGIPEGIRRKSGPLSAEEHQEIQRHASLGARILESMDLPEDLISAVLYHHEHFDGRGYPEHRKGEAIPIGARILGLVEAYEVMTAGRYGRKPFTYAQAKQEIEARAGTQFDPRLTSLFLAGLSGEARVSQKEEPCCRQET